MLDGNEYYSKLQGLLDILRSRLDGEPDDTEYIGFGKTEQSIEQYRIERDRVLNNWKKNKKSKINHDVFSHELMQRYYDMTHLLKCFINNKTYGYDMKLNKRYTKLAFDLQNEMSDILFLLTMKFGYHAILRENKYVYELSNLIDILQSRHSEFIRRHTDKFIKQNHQNIL